MGWGGGRGKLDIQYIYCPILLGNIPKIYTTLSKKTFLVLLQLYYTVCSFKTRGHILVKGTEHGMTSSQAVQMFEVLKGTIISYYNLLWKTGGSTGHA